MFNFLKQKKKQEPTAEIHKPKPHSIPEAIRLTRIEFELFKDSRSVGMPLKPTKFYVRGAVLSVFVKSISFTELQESVKASGYTLLLKPNRGDIEVTIVKSVSEYRRNQSLRYQ